MRERDNEGTVGKGKRERKREKEKEKEITERKKERQMVPGYEVCLVRLEERPGTNS